jgi:hypothetical protein
MPSAVFARARVSFGVSLTLWSALVSACDGDNGKQQGKPDATDQDAEVPAPVLDAGPPPACEPCQDCEENIPATSATHREGAIDYPDPPPTGGDHNPCWLNFDVYTQEVPVERWVHNLEHGGVVLLYHCPEGCPAEVAALTKLTVGKPQVMVTPYAKLPTKFAAVSWGYRLLTDCFDEAQLQAFYDEHVDHAPESIASGPPAGYCDL